jgi:endoglucanase
MPTGGASGNGGNGAGGSATGGRATGGTGAGGNGGGGSTGGLPPLQVNGTKLQDPNGRTIILRGSSLIDIGALYAYNSNSVKGITDRMDKLATAGVQGHVVRFPVYPKIDYNGGYPYCSDLPYPVGTGPGTSCTAKSPLSAADYVSKVLKPAVDYATSKNLYVIIDHHQIDDVITGTTANTSAADAKTFWTDIAPKFASYGNVLFEPFNEPISGSATWAQIKPVVQGLVDTIRAGGASNVIIVPSNSYCQRPGDAASDPPTDPKSNLMYTAHVYPGNWNATFKAQVATAVTKAPVFFTEWGYILNSSDSVAGTSSATWGSDFRTLVDANGGSWTAWVTDNSWTPNIFSDAALTQLTDFGTLAKTWLAAKATSDWVE